MVLLASSSPSTNPSGFMRYWATTSCTTVVWKELEVARGSWGSCPRDWQVVANPAKRRSQREEQRNRPTISKLGASLAGIAKTR